jgi:TolA-binding protein
VSQVQPLAPVEWDARRLDTLDRNVRRLERAVTQRNAVGQPVLVEPDPEVVALQGQVSEMDRRLQDLEASLQRITRDQEQTAFKLDEVSRDNAGLRTRLTATDGRIQAMEDQAKAAAAAAAEAEQAGRSPTGNAAGDLAAARALTDVAAQAEAYEVLITNWPGTPQSAEAGYRLGDLRRAADDMPGAVQAYAGALNGWPTTPWAGETTLKLARALASTNRNPQACAALGEFNRRYAATASAQLKTVAGQIRTQARCT